MTPKTITTTTTTTTIDSNNITNADINDMYWLELTDGPLLTVLQARNAYTKDDILDLRLTLVCVTGHVLTVLTTIPGISWRTLANGFSQPALTGAAILTVRGHAGTWSC